MVNALRIMVIVSLDIHRGSIETGFILSKHGDRAPRHVNRLHKHVYRLSRHINSNPWKL
jgi:hypothetical protein